MSPSRLNFRSHIPVLDGMRGIAVLLVIVYHFTAHHVKQSIEPGSFNGVFSQFFNVGWCGVDLFFVLSGFLITGILCDAKGASNYFPKFWMRRILRIFPLYYGFLLVLFVLVPLAHRFSPLIQQHLAEQRWLWGYGSNFYYSMASHPLIDAFRLQHFWSLAIEEQYYLIWPFVIFFLQPRAAIRVSLVCIAVALGLRVILAAKGCDPIIIWNLTPCRMDGLAVGALCALAVRADFKMNALLKAVRPITILSAMGLIAILFWRRTWSWDDRVMESVGISLINLFCGGILLAAINSSTGTALQWLLSCPVLTIFGFYSYAIYVFHFPLIREFNRWFSINRLSLDFHSWFLGLAVNVACSTIISLFVAMLSWHLYEKHFLKLKSYFSLVRKAEASDQSVVKARGHLRDFFGSWTHDLSFWLKQCPFRPLWKTKLLVHRFCSNT
jgi:peptidoglycan/LPS O-acetylase OafA/YrhL